MVEGCIDDSLAFEPLPKADLMSRMIACASGESCGFHHGHSLPRSDVDLESSQAGT